MNKTIICKFIVCEKCGKKFKSKINKSKHKVFHSKCEKCRNTKTGIRDLSSEQLNMLGNCCAMTDNNPQELHHIIAWIKWEQKEVDWELVEDIKNWLLLSKKEHNIFSRLQRTREKFYYSEIVPLLQQLNTLYLNNINGNNHDRIISIRGKIRKLTNG